MLLVPEIDECKTRANARKLLSTYRKKKRRIVGKSIDPYSLIRSPEITDEPMNHSNVNSLEKTMVHKLRNVHQIDVFSKELDQIDSTIDSLSNVSKRILKLSYCDPDKLTIRDIAFKLEIYQYNIEGRLERVIYSEKNIEKLKSQALVEFAEAYSGDDLVVLKK